MAVEKYKEKMLRVFAAASFPHQCIIYFNGFITRKMDFSDSARSLSVNPFNWYPNVTLNVKEDIR